MQWLPIAKSEEEPTRKSMKSVNDIHLPHVAKVKFGAAALHYAENMSLSSGQIDQTNSMHHILGA